MTVIYNLTLHPLAHLPGPKLWGVTRFRYVISLVSGNLARDIRALHARYGNIVRTAPDEVSFASLDAYPVIYGGQKPFPKDPVYFTPPLSQPHNLFNTPDDVDHARMRRVISLAFTPAAVEAYESIIVAFVDLMVAKLKHGILKGGKSSASPSAVFNVTAWYNYISSDIISDLAFGESFGCLENGNLHPWVASVFDLFKGISLMAGARYYPWIENILTKMFVPRSFFNQAEHHYVLSVKKIRQRIESNTPRSDFVSSILTKAQVEQILNNDASGLKGMTVSEFEATISMLAIAGSENVGTTLCGITTYLLLQPSSQPLDRLVQEVRSTFKSSDEITVSAVQNLPYLNATIAEGLRLGYPLPSGLPRIVPSHHPSAEIAGVKDGVGAYVCNTYLPPGTHAVIPQNAIARDENLFSVHASDPPAQSPESGHDGYNKRDHVHPAISANDFVPERWLPATHIYALSQLKSGQFSPPPVLYPFLMGPKSCLGQRLAWSKMRLILARLMWEFDFAKATEPGRGITPWDELKTYHVIQREPIWVELRAGKGLNSKGP